MSTAGSVTVEPTSPASLSTVRTSSTEALLCLPPQRTIAYTTELSLPGVSPPRQSRPRPNVEATGPADSARQPDTPTTKNIRPSALIRSEPEAMLRPRRGRRRPHRPEPRLLGPRRRSLPPGPHHPPRRTRDQRRRHRSTRPRPRHPALP